MGIDLLSCTHWTLIKMTGKEHVVYFDVGSVIHCSCGLFEHMGIVCRHSLKVGFKIILTGVNWVILYYYIIHVFSRLFLLVRYAKFSFMYFFFL